MTSPDERLQRLETQVERLTRAVNERLERLESAAEAASGEGEAKSTPSRSPSLLSRVARVLQRLAGWMGAELPKLLAALVILLVGWGIKDSVDLSIKQRQLDLSYTKEMQGLLQVMRKEPGEKTELESTAVVLASFGEAALPSLIGELRNSGLHANAAAQGISTLLLTHPAAVCEALPQVLVNRGKQFDWQSHLIVVRLLGEGNCSNSKKPLKRYREIVSDARNGETEGFEELVRKLPAAPKEDYNNLLDEIDRSLRLVGQ